MQHIGLQRESETGEVLADFNQNGIDVRIVERAPKSTICLRFIDPYGDTVFNQLQIPTLIAELQNLGGNSSDAEFEKNIKCVIQFLKESVEIHTYVRFIGD